MTNGTTGQKKFQLSDLKLSDLFFLVKNGRWMLTVLFPVIFFLASHGVFDGFWDKMGLTSKSKFDKTIAYNSVVLCVTSGLFTRQEQNNMLIGFVNGNLNSDSLLFMLIRKSNERQEVR